MLEAGNPSLPHGSPFHFSGLSSPSYPHVGTTVSSCHSSSPEFPEIWKTFWRGWRRSDVAAAALWKPGRSNSQCCQPCADRKPPAWKIINQLVYDCYTPFLSLFLVTDTLQNLWLSVYTVSIATCKFPRGFSTLYVVISSPSPLFYRHHYHPPPSPSCLHLSFLIPLLFLPPPSLSFSDGPDLLEGHRANRHGADRVSGRPAVPVPAQHHHRGLHSLPGRHVLHHLSAHLLPSPLHPQLGRWRTPLQVRRCALMNYAVRTVDISSFSFFFPPAFLRQGKEKWHNALRWIHPIQSQCINVFQNKSSLSQKPFHSRLFFFFLV